MMTAGAGAAAAAAAALILLLWRLPLMCGHGSATLQAIKGVGAVPGAIASSTAGKAAKKIIMKRSGDAPTSIAKHEHATR